VSFYQGRHARLYDLFYAGTPYREEAEFVAGALRRFASGPVERVLELACGTGEHALHLERLGYRVTGTDLSADMVGRATEKAREAGSSVEFRVQDMRALPVPEEPYDATVCLFDSIGYVQSNEAVGEVLRGVHRGLRPGGLFVAEFWHAAAMLRSYDPVRVRRWATDEGEVLRISETRLDYERQLGAVAYRIYELGHDGRYSTLEETHVNRYFSVQEMAALLGAASLEPLHFYAGFDDEATLSDRSWHVVAVARRAG
jgi:SAM-dependent methyltransferase